jgi:hypothetical protein
MGINIGKMDPSMEISQPCLITRRYKMAVPLQRAKTRPSQLRQYWSSNKERRDKFQSLKPSSVLHVMEKVQGSGRYAAIFPCDEKVIVRQRILK